jgi:zinc/manganese transport system substrate-binding protein
MTPSSRRTIPALAAVSLALAACGSSADNGDAQTSDDSGPTVVATTSIWADIVDNVACDGLVEIDTVIPPGGDPHSFEPSLRDRERMEEASLVVANGLDLEESLADTIDAVEDGGVRVLRVADGLDTVRFDADDEDHDDEDHDDEDHHGDDDHADEDHADKDDHGDDDHGDEDHAEDEDHGDDDHEHDHAGDDPHVWWDPTLVSAAVPMIADELEAAGIDRAALDTCAADYLAELAELDDEVFAMVEQLPVDVRVLVTNHDSMSYFAERYDFTVLGSVIPSASSLAAASPAELDELATAIDEAGVAAIFAETQQSSADIDALANRVGGVEVVELLTGTLGESGSDSDTYVGWLRTNAATIVDALMPGGGSGA